MFNPIGLRCQECHYSLRRDCPSDKQRCPQTASPGELGTPVSAGRSCSGEHGLPEPGDLLGILVAAVAGVDLEGIGIWPVPSPPTSAGDELAQKPHRRQWWRRG